MQSPLAHSGGHLLAIHLQAVASQSQEFAANIDSLGKTQGWAYLAGLSRGLISRAYGTTLASTAPAFNAIYRLQKTLTPTLRVRYLAVKKPILRRALCGLWRPWAQTTVSAAD